MPRPAAHPGSRRTGTQRQVFASAMAGGRHGACCPNVGFPGNGGGHGCLGRRRTRHRPRLRAARRTPGADRPRHGGAGGGAPGGRGGRCPASPGPAGGHRRCRSGLRRCRPRRGGARRDRHLGQLRHGDGLRAGAGDDAGGIPPRHRGDLSRLRPRHAGGAAPHAAAQRRHHRPGRLRAGLPRHPAAIRLLRGEVSRSAASPIRCGPSCGTTAAASA